MEVDLKDLKDSPLPKYYQIKEILLNHIKEKKFKPGDSLPSENELASKFKVTKVTASRALNELVSQGILYRIQGKGTFLNDRILSSGKIAVLSAWNIPKKDEVDQSSYGSILFRGLRESISDAGHSIILKNPTEGQVHQLSSTREVLGLIITTPRMDEQGLLERLPKLLIPSMIVGANLKRTDINYVATDNTDGIQKAVDYLISLGHKKIAFIGATPGSFDTQDRFEAFSKICNRLPSSSNTIIPEGKDLKDEIEDIFSEWQKRNSFPSAVIAGGLSISPIVMETARNFGKKIPEDISLVGFDEFSTAAHLTPPLTTLRQPLYEMGKRGGQLLIENIADFNHQPVARQEILPTQLIIRSSCRKFKKEEKCG